MNREFMTISFVSIIFALLLIVISSTFARAQDETVVTEPFTEIGKPDCEFLWAQLDLVLIEMSKNPASTLTIDMTAVSANPPHVNRYWYEFIRSYFARRKVASERWRIRTQPLAEQWSIRFWIVSPGVKPPPAEQEELSWKYRSDTKPFLFTHGESNSVEVGVCLYVDEVAMLAEALKENPGARVNIVFVVRSDREFERRKRNVSNQLSEYSVTRSRVRFFKQVSRKQNPYGIDPTTEYWLLP